MKKEKLRKIAKDVRKTILKISYDAQVGHVGSALSVVDILVALYFNILKTNPQHPTHPSRDRFILSKGHAAPALYAVLYKKGYLTKKTLQQYCRDGGLLEEHPTHNVSGIEVSTGSLGHGLSIGTGMALSAKIQDKSHRVFVLISDAELDEGETWSAVLSAAHYSLDNLFVLIDYNKVQALGKVAEILNVEPLAEKFQAFGWNVIEVDGHNISMIIGTVQKTTQYNRPTVIICHTIRGKGVSFMEHAIQWHYLSPSREHFDKALKELE